jgi:hypothetical protein
VSQQREFWIGSVFVVEWDLEDIDGEPVTEATVAGTVATPAATTVPMQVVHEDGSNVWRLTYTAVAAGRHGYRATATPSADGAIAGEFIVNRDITGAPPIERDLTTPVGQVRLLTTDTDEAFPLHTDAEIEAFLTIEGGNVKRAAAAQLEAIATSETLVSKKITTQDLSTDGPAVAKDLRERAKLLRDQAENADDDADELADGYGFDAVAMPSRSWSWWG